MQLHPARVKGGVVYIDGHPAPDVKIMADGESPSSGTVVISESEAIYITNTQPDLMLIVSEISKICDQLITIGNHSYVVGAQGQVNGTPLAPIAVQAEAIKTYLTEFKPL